MEINGKNSIFSFLLHNRDFVFEKLPEGLENQYTIGRFILHTDNRTPLQYFRQGSRELIIFGYAVDVISGQYENLPETVLGLTKDFNEVIDYEKRLGGKYIIVYAEKDKCYCSGDATCSVPVFYCIGLSGTVCCSNPKFIADEFDLKKDHALQKIRESGPLGQAMPFDITVYKEIKQLLPNHYFDLKKEQKARFINCEEKQKNISVKEAVNITQPMAEKMMEYYMSLFDIYCPLTGGRDSRVIYALLKKYCGNDINSYTVWLDHLKKDKQDWDIPIEVTKQGMTHHEQIDLIDVSLEEKTAMDNLLGKDGYPYGAFALSLTIKKHYSEAAVIEGDILGQISQCHVNRNVPTWLAGPRYFRCKVHNYSPEAIKLMKAWMDEIKKSDEQVNIMDLFCVENRLGIWASYTHLVRNLLGQLNLNNFNSRSIIYIWTAVDSTERSKALINLELIRNTYPETLKIPFGQDSGLFRIAKRNWFAFYLATFLKYYIEKRRFIKNKNRL